jgi:hypothetical protein
VRGVSEAEVKEIGETSLAYSSTLSHYLSAGILDPEVPYLSRLRSRGLHNSAFVSYPPMV